MKKILTLLTTMALTTTASTSAIACGGKEEPKSANPTGGATGQPGTTNAPQPMPQAPVTKTNLNGLPDNLEIEGVSKYTKRDFFDKLITELNKQQGFGHFGMQDIEIKKIDGTTSSDLGVNDIVTKPNLKIKVKALDTNKNFEGWKEITVNLTVNEKTNLRFLSENLEIKKIPKNNLNSFKRQLASKIEQQQGFGHFGMQDIEIKKIDGTTSSDLGVNDIVTKPNLKIKVKALDTNKNFEGWKEITVNLKVITNLNTLPSTLDIELENANKTVDDFKAAVIDKLYKENGFEELTENDIEEIKKIDGTTSSDLGVNDIVTKPNLKIKVKALDTSENFTGSQAITVNLTIS